MKENCFIGQASGGQHTQGVRSAKTRAMTMRSQIIPGIFKIIH